MTTQKNVKKNKIAVGVLLVVVLVLGVWLFIPFSLTNKQFDKNDTSILAEQAVLAEKNTKSRVGSSLLSQIPGLPNQLLNPLSEMPVVTESCKQTMRDYEQLEADQIERIKGLFQEGMTSESIATSVGIKALSHPIEAVSVGSLLEDYKIFLSTAYAKVVPMMTEAEYQQARTISYDEPEALLALYETGAVPPAKWLSPSNDLTPFSELGKFFINGRSNELDVERVISAVRQGQVHHQLASPVMFEDLLILNSAFRPDYQTKEYPQMTEQDLAKLKQVIFALFKEYDFSNATASRMFQAIRSQLVSIGDLELLEFMHARNFPFDTYLFQMNGADAVINQAGGRNEDKERGKPVRPEIPGTATKVELFDWFVNKKIYPSASLWLKESSGTVGRLLNRPETQVLYQKAMDFNTRRKLPFNLKNPKDLGKVLRDLNLTGASIYAHYKGLYTDSKECGHNYHKAKQLNKEFEYHIHQLLMPWFMQHRSAFSDRLLDIKLAMQQDRRLLQARWSAGKLWGWQITQEEQQDLRQLQSAIVEYFIRQKKRLNEYETPELAASIEGLLEAEVLSKMDLQDSKLLNTVLLAAHSHLNVLPKDIHDYDVSKETFIKSMTEILFYESAAFSSDKITRWPIMDYLPMFPELEKQMIVKDELQFDVLFYLIYFGDLKAIKQVIDYGNQFVVSEGVMNHLDIALLTYKPNKPEIVNYLLKQGYPVDNIHHEIVAWLENQYPGKVPKLH